MRRRDFLTTSSKAAIASLAIPVVLDNIVAHAFAPNARAANLANHLSSNDRTLVIIQMQGGNDGLNMVVPYTNSEYYNKRPSIAIPPSSVLTGIGVNMGLHPAMTGVKNMFDNGKVAVVQNVGEPQPNRSHFRGTDMWTTGSDYNTELNTGWMGRWLGKEYPNFPDTIPPDPLAIQVGTSGTFLFEGPRALMGISFSTVQNFFDLVSGSGGIDEGAPAPATPSGDELSFIRKMAQEASEYANNVKNAYGNGKNLATYPSNNSLAKSLAIVAKLITGGLGTRVYHVTIGGFDTHAQQGSTTGSHATLLGRLSDAVAAFFDDLTQQGKADKVIAMTFSEFGRRVLENGAGSTAGTDHGAAAPHFVFGTPVRGGVFGKDPDLGNLDGNFDIKMQYDFRYFYGTILEEWFGVTHADSVSILNNYNYAGTLGVINNSINIGDEKASDRGIVLHQNYPNPVNASTTVRYELPNDARVSVNVYDIKGGLVDQAFNGQVTSGMHEVSLYTHALSPGSYRYELVVDGMTKLGRMMNVVR